MEFNKGPSVIMGVINWVSQIVGNVLFIAIEVKTVFTPRTARRFKEVFAAQVAFLAMHHLYKFSCSGAVRAFSYFLMHFCPMLFLFFDLFGFLCAGRISCGSHVGVYTVHALLQ